MRIIYFILIFILLISCEDSEVCEDDYTPLMYLEFRKKATDSLTNKNNYFVVLKDVANKEINYKIENNSSTLKLPISFENSTKTKSLTLFLEENATEDKKLIINFEYDIKPQYISKACGFRYTFANFETKINQLGFAVDVKQNTNKIENEFSSHITIFD